MTPDLRIDKNTRNSFLRGGGEMGELIRAKDWSQTSLGDPAAWPQSLRITLTILLNSKFPMFLWWGSELICFYNDAYRPSLGIDGKHPSILGMPAVKAWPEIWSIVKPLIDQVMDLGEAVWFEDLLVPIYRNGKIEDVYWTFSYSPVPGDTEQVAGVLVTCTETTEKVFSLKKLEESDQRFRSTMKQAPVGITILRGPDYVVEMANNAYLQLVDKKESEFVGNPLFSSLPEVEESVHALLDNVLYTGIPYHGTEVPVPLSRQGKQEMFYFDFLYHPLKEEDGKISGVIVAVTEVTEKVESRSKIEESKRIYETITQNTPDLIYVFDLQYRFRYANEALLKMWGRSWDDSAGKTLLEVGYEPWHAEMHEREIDEVIATKKPVRGEVSFPHANLGKRIYDYIFVPVIDRDGRVEAIAGTTRDITQQIEARNKIEEDTQKLNIVIDASELGTWELNLKNKETKYSKRYLEILGGYTEDIVLNHAQLIQHLHPDDLPIREKAFKEAFATGYLHYEARLIWKDQSIHWMEGKGIVFYEEENVPVRILGTIRDITEEKMHEQELTERETKFRLLADSMPQHIWTSDTDGNFTYFNKSVFAYSGLTLEQLNKEGLLQIIHVDDRAQHLKHWIESVSTGKDFLVEHRFLRHDGEYRWQLSRAIPQRDANGKIQMWVGTSTDIQEQKTFTKELEEKVLARTAELKESEEKFFNLFNLSPICTTLSDGLGKIIMVNDAFTNTFGYSREDILNKSSAEVGMLDTIRRENVIRELKTHGKIQNTEIEFYKKSGEKFFALTSAEIINIGDKQYFLAAYNDISDRKKAEMNIEQKNIELERMNKELQAFAYISSHDLQEPLRKIQTFASRIAAKEESNLTEYGQDMFNRMQQAAQRMQTLIQDLLAYSRTNTQEKIFEHTDLNEIIAEVKDDLKEELKEKHAIIEANHLCDVDIIPFQFRQLMHNLIGNSLKFAKPDDPPIIQIKSEMINGSNLHDQKLSSHRRYCHITVADNGIGFEQQYSEKIFDVFQRLHGKNEYIGTGIGLAIVKKIVENHQGVITAHGEPNKGATFEIYIPVR